LLQDVRAMGCGQGAPSPSHPHVMQLSSQLAKMPGQHPMRHGDRALTRQHPPTLVVASMSSPWQGEDMLAATDNEKLVQGVLGDNADALARLAEIHEEARALLEGLGPGGIDKPKCTLQFVKELTYNTVGGSSLSASACFASPQSAARAQPGSWTISR
jgi:hypothetical protein